MGWIGYYNIWSLKGHRARSRDVLVYSLTSDDGSAYVMCNLRATPISIRDAPFTDAKNTAVYSVYDIISITESLPSCDLKKMLNSHVVKL